MRTLPSSGVTLHPVQRGSTTIAVAAVVNIALLRSHGGGVFDQCAQARVEVAL